MIYSKFKATYDGNHDTFRVEFLVVPTAILAFLVNHDFTPLEVGYLAGSLECGVAGQLLTVEPLGGWLRLPYFRTYRFSTRVQESDDIKAEITVALGAVRARELIAWYSGPILRMTKMTRRGSKRLVG